MFLLTLIFRKNSSKFSLICLSLLSFSQLTFAQTVPLRTYDKLGLDSLIQSSTSDPLLTSLADKPGPLLLSLGRKARQAGKFSDSILYFKASLRSLYGEREFDDELKLALIEVNTILKNEVKQTLSSYLDSKSKQSIELSLRESALDPGSYKKRSELQIRFFFTRVLPNETRRGLFQSASRHLQNVLRKKFPKNTMRFFANQGRYYFEGYFNSEYPNILPMAHYELASLYKEYKDFILADFHFKQALNYKQYFEVPETVYAIYYNLAEISSFSGKIHEYESNLKEIVKADRDFFDIDNKEALTRKVVLRSFRQNGQNINNFLQLYRINDDFSRDAHRLLGKNYYQQENYEGAIAHLLFAVIKPLTKIIEELKIEVYGFQFKDLDQLFNEIKNYPHLVEYVKISHLYESIYLLARTNEKSERRNVEMTKSMIRFLDNPIHRRIYQINPS